jgi:hypothetical protein
MRPFGAREQSSEECAFFAVESLEVIALFQLEYHVLRQLVPGGGRLFVALIAEYFLDHFHDRFSEHVHVHRVETDMVFVKVSAAIRNQRWRYLYFQFVDVSHLKSTKVYIIKLLSC